MTDDHVIVALDSISSVDDDAQLERLELAVRALPSLSEPLRAVPALLRVFERFPTSDAYGIFWSILHAMERIPGHEPHVIASIRRAPSLFALTTINRMMNANITAIDGVPLLPLLDAVAETDGVPDEVRAQAASFAAFQRATTH